jgi:hypothetical protein
MAKVPTEHDVLRLLTGLLSRDVSGATIDFHEPHEMACHGLVDNNDILRYVIGADLAFAHRASAAMAMLPIGLVEEAGDEPDEELIEIYSEVANLTSRAVNEAAPARVRLDPNLTHDPAVLKSITDKECGLALEITIAGYGTGRLGIWSAN